MTTENHRRDTRVAVQVPVVLIRGKKESALETSDVSYRGLFLRTAEPPALRSLIRFRVTLPDRTFETHAMVVHVIEQVGRQPGIGLQFWGLAGSDQRAWDDFVRQVVAAQLIIHTPSTPHPAGTKPVSGVRLISPRLPDSSKAPGTGSDNT